MNNAKLGDIVSFKTGKLNSNAAIADGEYPFFTCSQETYRTNTYSFDTECVLLGGNNAAGIYPLKFYSGKFDAYQRTYIIRTLDEEKLINRYLYYSLRPQLELMKSISTGAATKFLTLTILRDIEISLHSMPSQHKIASILSAYDDLIENNLKRIKLLEEMAQMIYREWFVNFRIPGHEKVKMVDSPLGKIPEGWEVRTVQDSFEITGGGTPSKKISEYWAQGSINWFVPSDLTAHKTVFMDESGNKITELGLKKSSARLFPEYSVMMTSRATLGIISINTTEACTNQGFITCIPSKKFPLYTLYYWLRENVEKFISLGTGATFKEITKGVFKKIELVIPQKKLVFAFEDTIEPIMSQILNIQRKNNNLRETRDLLLPKLISGELDVENIDVRGIEYE